MFALKDIVTWTHPRSGKMHTGGNRPYLPGQRQRALRGAGVASVGSPPAPLPTESGVAEEIALTTQYYSANMSIS